MLSTAQVGGYVTSHVSGRKAGDMLSALVKRKVKRPCTVVPVRNRDSVWPILREEEGERAKGFQNRSGFCAYYF